MASAQSTNNAIIIDSLILQCKPILDRINKSEANKNETISVMHRLICTLNRNNLFFSKEEKWSNYIKSRDKYIKIIYNKVYTI